MAYGMAAIYFEYQEANRRAWREALGMWWITLEWQCLAIAHAMQGEPDRRLLDLVNMAEAAGRK